MASTSLAFSAWLPWLMLIRNASAPASTRARIISGSDEAGPRVARIFTLRARGFSMSSRSPRPSAPAITAAASRSTGLRRRLGSPRELLQFDDPKRFGKGGTSMSEGNVAADQLRLFIERIERLEEEKKGIADDVKDVYSEAKANGYDSKTMRKIVSLRRMEKHARDEADALLETYR